MIYNGGKRLGEVSLPLALGLALEYLVYGFDDCRDSCQNFNYRFCRFELA